MPSSKYWDDPTRYALLELDGNRTVVTIAGGGGYTIIDSPDADAAIAELVASGCPIVKSWDDFLQLVRRSRGESKWDLVGDSRINLWQDQWGEIWLHCEDSRDVVHSALRLSKYEALGLAEKLLELGNLAPHHDERPPTNSTG